MIRTDTVELTAIQGVAFRQKLPSGGSGITILRYDMEQPGIASISKTSSEAIPAANTPMDKYPMKAFDEAIQLTAGMPYTKRGSVKLVRKKPQGVAPKAKEEVTEEEVIIDSGEYQKLVDYYTDKNGKISYELLNRDLIRFAHSSKTVRGMVAEGASLEEIRSYIVCNKFRKVIGNTNLSEEQIMKMAELLDEVSPQSVFKALDSDLKKQMSENRKAGK